MKIITTPMCEEIVKLAGITDYALNKFPDEEAGDLAIVLSESKVEMDSHMGVVIIFIIILLYNYFIYITS